MRVGMGDAAGIGDAGGITERAGGIGDGKVALRPWLASLQWLRSDNVPFIPEFDF